MLKPHLLIWVRDFQFSFILEIKDTKSLTLKGRQKVGYAVNIEVRDHFLLSHAVTFLDYFSQPQTGDASVRVRMVFRPQVTPRRMSVSRRSPTMTVRFCGCCNSWTRSQDEAAGLPYDVGLVLGAIPRLGPDSRYLRGWRGSGTRAGGQRPGGSLPALQLPPPGAHGPADEAAVLQESVVHVGAHKQAVGLLQEAHGLGEPM